VRNGCAFQKLDNDIRLVFPATECHSQKKQGQAPGPRPKLRALRDGAAIASKKL
jgi:hypothetical protein